MNALESFPAFALAVLLCKTLGQRDVLAMEFVQDGSVPSFLVGHRNGLYDKWNSCDLADHNFRATSSRASLSPSSQKPV